MSNGLETMLHSEFIYDAISHMRTQRVRRLPVVDARPAGDGVAGFLACEQVDVARVPPTRFTLERGISAPGRPRPWGDG